MIWFNVSFAPKIPFLPDLRCKPKTLGAKGTLSAKPNYCKTRYI
jgi:hypothetical protein